MFAIAIKVIVQMNHYISNLIRVPIADNSTTNFLEGYLDIVESPTVDSIYKNQNQSNFKTGVNLVIFSHGSGSSKDSIRNNTIASIFHKMGLSTLLIDLLTDKEKETDLRTVKISDKIPGLVLNKFNITLLKQRLVSITKWLANDESLSLRSIGYFGSSTGATAAFLATLELINSDKDTLNNCEIATIVSRGGRTDLIDDTNVYDQIRVPILFIVGSKDKQTIKINQKTMEKFYSNVNTRMEVIEGASHLFEEVGKVDKLSEIAGNWFLKFL